MLERMLADEISNGQSARSDAYRILADFYRDPGEVTTEAAAALAAAITAGRPDCGPLADQVARAVPRSDAERQVLRVAHAALFVGPFELLAPPYASVYLDPGGTLMGASVQAVVDAYRAAGLHLDENHHQPPDHISTELEFLYYLSFRVAQYADDSARSHLRAFLNEHALLWIPAFNARVQASAAHPFWCAAASLTAAWLAADAASLA